MTFQIYPFSVKEAMKIRRISEDPRDKEAFLGLIEEMIVYGSYPEIFLERDPAVKKKLLLEYYESIVARDVSATHGLDWEKADEIAAYLLKNVGNRISVNSLSKTFKISFHTAEKYLYALTDSMVFFEVRRFAYSTKEQMAFPRKFYPIDLGLRWAVAKRFSADKGRLFESLLAIEMRKAGIEFYYWLEKRECDFLLARNGVPFFAIQATFELNEENKEREFAGLREVERKFKLPGSVVDFQSSRDFFLNLLPKIAKV